MKLDDATVAAIRTLADAALIVSARLNTVLSSYSNASLEAMCAREIVERAAEPDADLLGHAAAAREASSQLIDALDSVSLAARGLHAAAEVACKVIEDAMKENPHG